MLPRLILLGALSGTCMAGCLGIGVCTARGLHADSLAFAALVAVPVRTLVHEGLSALVRIGSPRVVRRLR
jgi:hypothetical protein